MAIPLYAMQTIVLPLFSCDEIDRISRKFLWGSSSNNCKMHNVNWEIVCLPKEKGGLGIKSAVLINQAFIMKLEFSFLSQPNSLWVHFL